MPKSDSCSKVYNTACSCLESGQYDDFLDNFGGGSHSHKPRPRKLIALAGVLWICFQFLPVGTLGSLIVPGLARTYSIYIRHEMPILSHGVEEFVSLLSAPGWRALLFPYAGWGAFWPVIAALAVNVISAAVYTDHNLSYAVYIGDCATQLHRIPSSAKQNFNGSCHVLVFVAWLLNLGGVLLPWLLVSRTWPKEKKERVGYCALDPRTDGYRCLEDHPS